MKKKALLTSICFLITFNLFSQIPAGFKLKDIFKLDSTSLADYAYSLNSCALWQVSVVNDSIRCVEFKGPSNSNMSFPPYLNSKSRKGVGNLVSVKVFNGWIVGRDYGEWGGDLKWYSTKGEDVEISPKSVHQIENYNGRIFALSGWLHGIIATGELLELSYDNKSNKWVANAIYKCDGYPFRFINIDSNLYLITSTNLVKLDKDSNAQILIKKGFWELSHPNSMIIYDGSLHIGMKGGILRVTDSNGDIKKEWFENKIKQH